MVKAVIFDCFGVLTTEGWLPFKAKYFGNDPELFERATDISHQADRGMMSSEEAARETAGMAGISTEEFKSAIGGNVPDEDLFNYLRELKPDYKLGFLSNISDNYLHRIFKQGHLNLFDVIQLSYESGFIKPEAGAYTTIAGRLGLEPAECVMVDDQERNVAGAREAGMQAVLYKDVEQLKKHLAPLLKA